jgi:hypothetical protein
MNGPWSQSWMREICTSGLMSGIWKRNGMTVTAPDLDSTVTSFRMFRQTAMIGAAYC